MEDEVATIAPTAVEAPHRHELDWPQQNILDAEQQAEIDALKAEVAVLKATPRAESSGGAVKRSNTYGRMFNM